jgi:hypothetical protein
MMALYVFSSDTKGELGGDDLAATGKTGSGLDASF